MSVSSQEMNTSFTLDTGTEELLCEVDQGVALVTLNKPHKKCAWRQTHTSFTGIVASA